MRIALISHTSLLAGAEKVLLNMALSLYEKDCIEIYLFAYGDGELKNQAANAGIRYISLENNLPWYLFVKDDIGEIADHWRNVQKSTEELTRYFLKYGIDCVLINTMTNLSGLIAAANLKLPSILWIHGIIDHMLLPQSGSDFKMVCDRVLINGATIVFCPTNWIKEHYQHYRNDISVVPNFTIVPDQIIDYPTNISSTVFTCFNTWNHVKGMDCLIDAAEIVKNEGKEFELNFYGSGEQQAILAELIEKKQLNGYVNLKGRVANISEVLNQSHALITASLIEPFGMTLIEAMAHARPIIVSDNSGHLEIVDDSNFGFLCETGNPASFAKKMIWVLENLDDAKKMGLNGYYVAKQKFNGTHATLEFIELIKKAHREQKFVDRSIYIDLMFGLLSPFLKETKQSLIEVPKNEDGNFLQIGEPLVPVGIYMNRSYKVKCTFDRMQEICFLIGTHHEVVTGTLGLKIFLNGSLLRECTAHLEKVADNSWVSFEFNQISHIRNKEITFTLSLNSENKVSVYENAMNYSVLTNFKNRLISKGDICCKIR
ncbi:glycosyltransferase [Paenibacillus sp. J22TS3]|uniref:glycosyltransferase n=1 Tax=Paenibacillus sp. J22TS3 TaxID=2807192 RepID=UPI001B073746|nr:glycosyltransferase [Paenibacillus sp. J22TS3]GIP21688.1 hypothetical protein J22TS3_19630 [Paenibacillus sp. J22TS3]